MEAMHPFLKSSRPDLGSFESSQQLLLNALASKEPKMISRLGGYEFGTVFRYILRDKQFNSFKRFQLNARYMPNQVLFTGDVYLPFSDFCVATGFFPRDPSLIPKFSELMLQDVKEINIAGSYWAGLDDFFLSSNEPKTEMVEFEHLNPLMGEGKNWLAGLQGKKVLVVHPFVRSIESQYKKRQLLFPEPDFLPEFELITYKAVQSQAYEKTEFKDWFEALDSMKQGIDKLDFDLAILGCGAYGLPLAAHIKRSGKTAFHLGGATQLIFGIRGNRWETEEKYKKGLKVFPNQYWVRPSSEETPKRADLVEDACYW